MKSRTIGMAILLGVSMLPISVINRTQVLAQTTTSTGARRQQVLVKRINQQAIRFYKTFIRQSVGNLVGAGCEMHGLLEDLLLAVDSLADPRYMRHNLVIVMQIASEIEQELLLVNTSSDVVVAWSRLHVDLALLAKMNGIKWSEAVITNELIAALASDVDAVSKDIQTELPQFHAISAATSADLPVLLSSFRSSSQDLKNISGDRLHYEIEVVRNHARAINRSLNTCIVSSALQRDWRRITSRLEALVRLYSLDSTESDHSSF